MHQQLFLIINSVIFHAKMLNVIWFSASQLQAFICYVYGFIQITVSCSTSLLCHTVIVEQLHQILNKFKFFFM